MVSFNLEENWYWFLLAAVVCYFIGCFNFAVLISHFKKRDIRKEGSGNPGTMNMTRTFGLKTGVLNFICDFLKGGLPTLAGYLIFKNYVFEGTDIHVADFSRYFYGIFVIIGHIFPVTFRFSGGKGIASTFGLFAFALSCEQIWYLPILIAFHLLILLFIALTEWGSMGSLIGVALLSIWQAVIFVFRYNDILISGWVIVLMFLLLGLNLLTWGAHHKNIFKLLGGEEHRTRVLKHRKRL